MNAILHSSKAQEPVAPTNGATPPPVKTSKRMKKVKKGVIFAKNDFALLWMGNIMFAGIFYKSRDDFSRA